MDHTSRAEHAESRAWDVLAVDPDGSVFAFEEDARWNQEAGEWDNLPNRRYWALTEELRRPVPPEVSRTLKFRRVREEG